jgi:hypothetical protein
MRRPGVHKAVNFVLSPLIFLEILGTLCQNHDIMAVVARCWRCTGRGWEGPGRIFYLLNLTHWAFEDRVKDGLVRERKFHRKFNGRSNFGLNFVSSLALQFAAGCTPTD